MVEDGKKIFQELLKESQGLKQEAWNYDHPAFSYWHEKAKKAVAQFAPVKIPAFSEILFGSDFYFSKAIEDRFEINDRIALVDDLNLVEKIFNEIVELLEKESARKRFLALHENKKNKSNNSSSEDSSERRFSEPLKKAKEMQFSSKEIAEIEGELIRLELEFSQARPNWDLIKRVLKFFLDYDAELALFTLPIIFKEYEKIRTS
jgi:hypothetical protein